MGETNAKMPKFVIHYAAAKELKFTVPKKWLEKPLLAVVEFYCDEYYNKKNPDATIETAKIGVNDSDGKSIAVETEITKMFEHSKSRNIHLCDLEVARKPPAAPVAKKEPAPAPAEEPAAAPEPAAAEEAANETEPNKKPKQTHQAPIKAGQQVAQGLVVTNIDVSSCPEPGDKPLIPCKYSSSCDLV